MSTSVRAVRVRRIELQDLNFLWPILTVVAVFICAEQLRDGAQLGSAPARFCLEQAEKCARVEVLTLGENLAVVSKDLSGRLQLIAAGAVFLTSFGALVWLCGLSVYRCVHLPLASGWRPWMSVGAFILVGLILWLLLTYEGRTYSLLLKSFEALVTEVIARTRGSDTAPVVFAWTYKLTGGLAILSAAVLALTAGVIVDRISSDPKKLSNLRRRCAALRTTLAAGAAVLASAVIVVRSLQHWALSLTKEPGLLQPIVLDARADRCVRAGGRDRASGGARDGRQSTAY
jgi:hypothetical protein